MTSSDPIASPTLALLYLAQGHAPKARAMIEELLRDDPLDGHALALARRVGPPPARINVRLEGSELVVTWQGVPIRPAVHVLAVTTRGDGARVRTGVTSAPCRAPFGRVVFARPAGHGALAACIGRVVPERGFVALAIAAPLSW